MAKKQKLSAASPPKLPPAAPPASAKLADDFVHQAASALVHKSTEASSHEGARARGLVPRRLGPDVARVVSYMPTEVSDRLNVYSASSRRTVSDCVVEAVREWLDRQ